ncbi:MAG TPA: hypothetical protein VFV67_19855 [Actinophytocola sp.]|uniref:hypothetical protein n=1 Tax=Actinophytocola sp. TaxID=1872138 RepID=UPI002DB771A4|nr:hypothetical protein [Actinophytocola sp.]HEU5472905.1 hypothetical protein [Actinophytocola sp.]
MRAVRTIAVGIVAAVTIIAGPALVAGTTASAAPGQASSGAITSGMADFPWV